MQRKKSENIIPMLKWGVEDVEQCRLQRQPIAETDTVRMCDFDV